MLQHIINPTSCKPHARGGQQLQHSVSSGSAQGRTKQARHFRKAPSIATALHQKTLPQQCTH